MQVLWLAIIVPSKYPISGVPNFRQNATVFNALANGGFSMSGAIEVAGGTICI